MKIGIFDSGLGGLIITHSLIQALPEYDYLYLGDTARVPYGNRSQEVIYQFTQEAVDYLFKHDCQLIIIACNTSSAEALRKIQQEYLPINYPDRWVLGVIIPTAEVVVEDQTAKKVGILATTSTVNSKSYIREIHKLNPAIKVNQQAAPLLVPLIENDGLEWADPILAKYLKPLIEKQVDHLVLGCTHYPILKDQTRAKVGPKIKVISQDEIIPEKLKDYLNRHPEIENKLTKNKSYRFLVTDLNKNIINLANQLFAGKIELEKVNIKTNEI